MRATFLLRTPAEIEAAAFGLGAQGFVQMCAQRLPPLYGGTIRYQAESPGREIWQSAADVARHGRGDCEDLAAYRVAELRRARIWALPRVLTITPVLRHVVVVYLDPRTGQFVQEDPSKRLGM